MTHHLQFAWIDPALFLSVSLWPPRHSLFLHISAARRWLHVRVHAVQQWRPGLIFFGGKGLCRNDVRPGCDMVANRNFPQHVYSRLLWYIGYARKCWVCKNDSISKSAAFLELGSLAWPLSWCPPSVSLHHGAVAHVAEVMNSGQTEIEKSHCVKRARDDIMWGTNNDGCSAFHLRSRFWPVFIGYARKSLKDHNLCPNQACSMVGGKIPRNGNIQLI